MKRTIFYSTAEINLNLFSSSKENIISSAVINYSFYISTLKALFFFHPVTGSSILKLYFCNLNYLYLMQDFRYGGCLKRTISIVFMTINY